MRGAEPLSEINQSLPYHRKENMKRLILFILLLTISISGIITGNGMDKPLVPVQMYVVDASLVRLIPVDEELIENAPEVMASEMLTKLIDGFDENKKIRRIMPEKRGAVSVKLDGTTAVVNLRTRYFERLPQNKEFEQLFVYQIVNSLTSIDGIDHVRFTVNGEIKKKFAGFLDMREIFSPDYLI